MTNLGIMLAGFMLITTNTAFASDSGSFERNKSQGHSHVQRSSSFTANSSSKGTNDQLPRRLSGNFERTKSQGTKDQLPRSTSENALHRNLSGRLPSSPSATSRPNLERGKAPMSNSERTGEKKVQRSESTKSHPFHQDQDGYDIEMQGSTLSNSAETIRIVIDTFSRAGFTLRKTIEELVHMRCPYDVMTEELVALGYSRDDVLKVLNEVRIARKRMEKVKTAFLLSGSALLIAFLFYMFFLAPLLNHQSKA